MLGCYYRGFLFTLMFLNILDHIPPVESTLNSTPSFKVSQNQHNLVKNPETKNDFQLVLQNKYTFSSSFSINVYFAGKCKFSRGFKMSLVQLSS